MASSELLKSIQAGKSLKKTVTNDRSAPAVDTGKGGGGGRGPSIASAPSVSGGAAVAAHPQEARRSWGLYSLGACQS